MINFSRTHRTTVNLNASFHQTTSLTIQNSPKRTMASQFYHGTSTQMNTSLQLVPQKNLLQLKQELTQTVEKAQMENLQHYRMKKIISREKSVSIAEQKKIQELKPQVEKIENLKDRIERVKHLDKCRRLIAYNTLKSW